MTRLMLIALALMVASAADAATLTVPSVTVTSPASTAIACTPSAASYPAPLASGAVVFSCTVSPSTWTGTVSLSSPNGDFATTSLAGPAFNIVVGATALGAGSYPVGTLTATP